MILQFTNVFELAKMWLASLLLVLLHSIQLTLGEAFLRAWLNDCNIFTFKKKL